MPCEATQDKWIIAESSDKMWSTGGEDGKPPQYTCCENLMNYIKGQKDMTPKDKSPRSDVVQYATGEERTFSVMRTKNFQMSKLGLENEEELEIKLSTFTVL